MKQIFLLILILVLSNSLIAEEWIELVPDKWWIDKSSIEYRHHSVRYWHKIIPEEQNFYALIYTEMDCRERKSKVLQFTGYSITNNERIVEPTQLPADEYVTPGSLNEVAFNHFCRSKPQ